MINKEILIIDIEDWKPLFKSKVWQPIVNWVQLSSRFGNF